MPGSPNEPLGRFVEPAFWVLIALAERALDLPALLDAVRRLDGPMGHGTLMSALARLERLRLVESVRSGTSSQVYRLTILGRIASGSASSLKGTAA